MRMACHNRAVVVGMVLGLSGVAIVGCGMPQRPAAAPPSNAAPIVTTTVDVKPVCSKVKTLSPKESEALTDLAQGLAPDSPLIAVLADYKRMRDEARACLNFK